MVGRRNEGHGPNTLIHSVVNAGFDMATIYATAANAIAQLALAPWSPSQGARTVAAAALTPAVRRRPKTLIAILSLFAICSFALARSRRSRR